MRLACVLVVAAGMAFGGILMTASALAGEADPYAGAAAAKAKADAAVREVSAALDATRTAYGAAWQELDSIATKIDAAFNEGRAAEGKKAEKADQHFITACEQKRVASRNAYDALIQVPPFGRRTMADGKLGNATTEFSYASNSLNNIRSLEDWWKAGKMDAGLLAGIYAAIEKRVFECRDQAAAVVNEVKAVKAEWDGRLAEAQKFVAGR